MLPRPAPVVGETTNNRLEIRQQMGSVDGAWCAAAVAKAPGWLSHGGSRNGRRERGWVSFLGKRKGNRELKMMLECVDDGFSENKRKRKLNRVRMVMMMVLPDDED